MDHFDELAGVLGNAVSAAYLIDRMELKDVKKQRQEAEIVMHAKEEQLSDLYLEHKKLAQELEDLERSSQYLKNIMEDLHLEEVKTKNSARITKKSLKKAERLYELNTQLTQKDKEVLFKRRLSLYVAKKYLGIHIEQGPGNELNVISWAEDSPIQSTCVQASANNEDLGNIFWESLSRKSQHFDQWSKLFQQE